MKFTAIDFDSWKRKEIFYYFSAMAPTGYSLTAEVDITNILAAVKKHGMKFFPAYLWLVTKCLNEQDEFKIAKVEGVIGKFDMLTPMYTAFHDDKTFSLMWTAFDDIFRVFHDNYLADKANYGENCGILSKKDELPPPNCYTVSCIPWVNFESFCVHTYENKSYYFPSVEAGKYYEKDGKIKMKLSLTCHHATTDGYHVSEFLKSFQKYADGFEEFIK